ncbi:glycosyltransferase [Microbacterium sp. XT11]|uniref:glycosyltransferase n=1 Tax=Microbacterium sp. XT11 TaxID=367477 RepID=UPI0008362247|nr:glycosyltransferase [Microbacterium sp. XT11]
MTPPSDVAVVITAFNPTPRLAETVHALTQEYPVVVVDDGSTRGAEILTEVSAAGASLIRQPNNTGIAAALNAGLRAAFDAGHRYAVTFDQDSSPAGDTIAILRSAFDALEGRAKIGGVVPEVFAGVRQARGAGEYPEGRNVIQSGMMLDADTFAELGAFDEALFIDLVDTEYELRAASARRPIVAAPTHIDHELGRTVRLQPFRFVPLRVTTMASTPFRYYYRARNRVLLTRRYLRRLPLRVLRDLAVDLAYFALILASSRPRRIMAGVLGRGVRDGLRGRGGKMPDELAAQAATITWALAER